ncbi:hypothetical protein ACFY36_30600 [Actinoplanes sp. NPDC000266]
MTPVDGTGRSGAVIAPGPRAIAVGGDVTGSVFVTGNGVVVNPYPALGDYYLDFRDELAGARDFVGRGPVFERISEFVRSRPAGYLRIIADAGLGKTALAAEAARRFAAPAFFARATGGVIRPDQLLNHLSVVLIARFDLPHDHLPARAGEDSAFFGLLLNEVSEKVTEPVWIVVDGLDEAEDPVAGRNTLLLPRRLPPHVYVLLTQRHGDYPLVTEPSTPVVDYPIAWSALTHQDDIEEYLRRQLGRPEIARACQSARPPVDPAAFVTLLKRASQGNFTYLTFLLADISLGAADAAPLDLDAVPHGLEGYYAQMWRRMRSIAEARGGDSWTALCRPVAGLLAAAQEPVSTAWLADLSGNDADDVRDQVITPWRRYLIGERDQEDERWRIIHRSFGDFLSHKVDVRGRHAAIADHYFEWPDRWGAHDGYATRHLSSHLRLAGDIDRLTILVTDRGWFEHQLTADPSAAGYLDDLSQAWATASSANAEALERGGEALSLDLEPYCALASASLHSLSRSIGSALLSSLFEAGVLRPEQAIALTHQNPHPEARSRDIEALASLLPDNALSRVLATARSIDESGPRVAALVAVAGRLTKGDRDDVLSEALIAARSMDDTYSKVDALVAVGSELPPDDRRLLHDAAVSVARQLEPDDRTTQLAWIAADMDEPGRSRLIEESLASAQSIADTQERADTLINLLVYMEWREGERRKIADEGVAAVRALAEPGDRVRAMTSLLPYVPADDAPALAEEVLDDGRCLTDPYDKADVLGGLLAYLPGTLVRSVRDEARTAAHDIDGEDAKARQLVHLAGQAPDSARGSLPDEALGMARTASTDQVRASLLTLLAAQLPEAQGRPVLYEALAVARHMDDDRARARALVDVAVTLPGDRASPILREAFRIPAAMQALGAVEADEVEWIDMVVTVAERLGPGDKRNALLAEALSTAQGIDPAYDRAHALVSLALRLGEDENRVILEAFASVPSIPGFRERAEILTAVIPSLDAARRGEALRDALAAIRDSDWSTFSGTVNITDDLVVEIGRMAWSAGGKAAALLNLALAVEGPQRADLIDEAFDALYDMSFGQQVNALASIAPHLAGEQVRPVLDEIGSMTTDPLREQAISALVRALAALVSPGEARRRADAIYGGAIPEELSATLAVDPHDAPPEPLLNSGSTRTHSFKSWDISDLYRLGGLATITIDADGLDQQQVRLIWDAIYVRLLEELCGRLTAPELIKVLTAVAGHRSGRDDMWQTAVTALLVRLVALGFPAEALARARARWGARMPTAAAVSLAEVMPDEQKGTLLREALLSARGRENEIAVIRALASATPQFAPAEREQIAQMVTGFVSGSEAEPSVSALALLAPHLGLLPGRQRLALWQKALRLASTGIRRDLLAGLPPLLILVEDMVDETFWPRLADTLRAIRRWWP